jgi:rhodanese-related sulfurtransferase
MQTVDRETLHALLGTCRITLIEALPADHYNAEHLPDARNVPGELTADLAAQVAPDRAGTIVVYCSGPGCQRSKLTAAAFTRLGYTDVRVYPGGKSDWSAAGLPFHGTRATPTTAARSTPAHPRPGDAA